MRDFLKGKIKARRNGGLRTSLDVRKLLYTLAATNFYKAMLRGVYFDIQEKVFINSFSSSIRIVNLDAHFLTSQPSARDHRWQAS